MAEYAPLKLYSWPTPNGQKVHIMLALASVRAGGSRNREEQKKPP